MKNIFKTVIMGFAFMVTFSCNASNSGKNEVIISKSELRDKIKGGWAGQVIGCTYGGPTEFQWNGIENDDSLIIQYQAPRTVPLEIGFEGIYPTERRSINTRLNGQTNEVSFDITGSGFVLTGYAAATNNQKNKVLEADIYIDNNFLETVKMPTSSLIRKHDVAWNYDLSEGEHSITLKTRNIPDGYHIHIRDLIVYSPKNPGKHEYF